MKLHEVVAETRKLRSEGLSWEEIEQRLGDEWSAEALDFAKRYEAEGLQAVPRRKSRRRRETEAEKHAELQPTGCGGVQQGPNLPW
jgi:hypothetical protein